MGTAPLPRARTAFGPSGPLKGGWIRKSRDEAWPGGGGPRGQGCWDGRTVESAGLGSKYWFHLTGWVITRCYLTSLSLGFHPCENETLINTCPPPQR